MFSAEQLSKLIRPPDSADPKKSRISRVLHIISLSIFGIILAIALASPFAFNRPSIAILSALVVLVLIILLQVLIRRGAVHTASWMVSLGLFLVDTLIIIFTGGVESSILGGYLAVTMLAGLLLGPLTGFHFAGWSVLVVLVLQFLDRRGGLPQPVFNLTPLAQILAWAANLGLSTTVLYLVMSSVNRIFELYVENERSLTKTNLELRQEIEARQSTEKLLSQSEERFRAAVLNSPYPMMLHADDGEVVLINHAWENISGYSQQEITTIEDWTSKAYRKHADQVAESISTLYEIDQVKEEGQFDIYTRKGEIRNWYFSSAPLPNLPDGRRLVLSIAMDITTLKEAENALRESEELLSKVTLATNDGIWDWDLSTNEVYFDPRYYTMAGYEIDDFPYRLEEFQARVHPEDIDQVMQEAEDHLQGRVDRFVVEFRFLKKDGSWMWVQGRGRIIEQDHLGNPTRLVGTHTDISDRKAAEQALEDYRLQLEDEVADRTQKLEDRVSEVEHLNQALTNLLEDYQTANQKLTQTSEALRKANQELESFTYSVSHDLRAPLRAIEGFSSILIDEYQQQLDKQAQHYLGLVRKNANQMDQLIGDLLELSRLGRKAIQKTQVDTRTIVSEVLTAVKEEQTDREIHFVIEDLPPCFADRRLLKQVFYNLISNAIKFTQKQEQPSVIIGAEPGKSVQPDQKRTYYVRDNGVGFDMAYEGKLFEIFQRLHSEEEFQGTGVGLAIVKRIIDRHNGRIWAVGTEGEGAAFYFELESINSQEG